MACGPSRVSALAVSFLAAATIVATPLTRNPPGAPLGGAPVSRDDEPVLVPGASFPEFSGRPIADLRLFRYDPAQASFQPIPFQIDEKIDKVFNEGLEYEFVETMYDVLGEDDGLLDAGDELAFMYRDAGQRAPSAVPWPEGAGPVRFEIEAIDTRPGVQNPVRYVYLFEGAALPESPVRYVQWDLLPTSPIRSEVFELGFTDRWLLTELRVFPDCGSGLDLIDRLKGRATPIGQLEIDEESWNLNSFYLGGRLGPVRAIRYVRGAKSGVNTIHFDLVYRNFWTRRVNLRLHSLAEFRFYFDWLPGVHTAIYTDADRSGAVVDGQPDAGLGGAPLGWSVMNSAGGGIGVVYSVPASPLFGRSEFYYLDDETFDDTCPSNPAYGDEDDAAWGDHGLRLVDVIGSNVDPIPVSMRLYPICGDQGSPSFGDAIAEMASHPIDTAVGLQTIDGSAVRSLLLTRAGTDVRLDWQPLEGATGYRVLASPRPEDPHESWTPLADTAEPTFVDAGAAATPGLRCYSVVPLLPGGPGVW